MTRLFVEQLENRDTPAALFVPEIMGFDPFPDFSGPKYVVLADVTGPEQVEWVAGSGIFTTTAAPEMLVTVGEGGGFRMKIYDGGRPTWHTEFDPLTGGLISVPDDYGNLLYDGMTINDIDARVGADFGVTADRSIYVTALPGGGPVIAKMRFDLASRTMTSEQFLIPGFSETYRGGCYLTAATIQKLSTDSPVLQNSSLLITPRFDTDPSLRGGPILTALNPDGTSFTLLVGGPDERIPTRFAPATIGVLADPTTGEFGFGMEADTDEDGTYDRTTVFTWEGRIVSMTINGDPSTDWWM